MPVPASTDGFVPLFNSRDLTGWKVDASDPESWSVEEGVVVARGRDYLSRNHLLSDAEFGDFVLRSNISSNRDRKAFASGPSPASGSPIPTRRRPSSTTR